MKSDLGAPTTRGGGSFSHMSDIRGYAALMGGSLHKKICKHGSHFDPPQKKNPETWVKFVENRVQNHGENFGK